MERYVHKDHILILGPQSTGIIYSEVANITYKWKKLQSKWLLCQSWVVQLESPTN